MLLAGLSPVMPDGTELEKTTIIAGFLTENEEIFLLHASGFTV